MLLSPRWWWSVVDAAASCPKNLLDFLDHDAANRALAKMPPALHARDKMAAGQDHRVDPLHEANLAHVLVLAAPTVTPLPISNEIILKV